MTAESIARAVSPLLRVRWEVALSVGRGVALELRDAHDRLEGHERARLGELSSAPKDALGICPAASASRWSDWP